jgi:HAD superfamily hydrolase (TIGR01662 family)
VAIRGVLFDWGGTIVRDDSLRQGDPYNAIASYAAKRLNGAFTADEFERAFQAALPAYEPGTTVTTPHIDAVIAEAFRRLGAPAGAQDVDACGRLFFQEISAANEVFDDARALLASLKYRGYRLGVVTNAIFPSNHFQPRVNELGLAGYFDSFVSSADVGLSKPNPAPYLRALGDLKLECEEAIFVGDTAATDIAGANAVGMRAVLLERTGRRPDGSDVLVIERLTALSDLLGDGPAL